ncbi:hypothetical protein HMPREF1981_01722 [Bacteroides pyogenes F0041]|uniref:Fimbrillin family protein n=1 Tax=Bacteroides pyogenes F0041 TaxID=1321819 RepID=U2DUX0_9BACE|nr:hypothetical protein [Bacteroides pyogenes]ERI85447.1 hypothetical protein HMPREF1981_01722 [Bacteroides pyogenes F0041]
MKTKKILIFLTLGTLFACQQNEPQETTNESLKLFVTVENDELGALTRSLGMNYSLGKNAFSAGEVLSVAAANEDFLPYTIGKDNYLWNNMKTTNQNVELAAHYPAVDNRQLREERILEGGAEYLFGTTEVAQGSSNAALRMKRMTVPVVLLSENGEPYNGNAKVTLHLQNEGVQNLRTGLIQAAPNALKEEIEINKFSDGPITNLIPQRLVKGQRIGTVAYGGIEKNIFVDQNISLSSGNMLSIRLSEYTNDIIIDGSIPLRNEPIRRRNR